jgi:nitrite reductase/ring-hydroxylating ferredoxin subunit/DMSO/TMAO reductase YedYZ heme-binding membrane subunit
MSARYETVGWNTSKIVYDAVFLAVIALYLLGFMWAAPWFQTISQPSDDLTLRMNAFGTCAFLLMTLILCIGPAARLDRRFLPLLYNRRHLGVMTAGVAATHAGAAMDWYFSYSPINRFEALLSGNTSFAQIQGFPFELFGIGGLLVLILLAATSHDFWLHFLTPRVWKALHMMLYAGYLSVVLHVSLGALQAAQNPLLPVLVAFSVVLVAGLHLAAARGEAAADAAVAPIHPETPWVVAGPIGAIEDGAGIVVHLADAEPVAIFRHDGKLSAVTNLCAHQNGPLEEGRVVDGCITCPWHGFQYRLSDGRAPPPFTEKLATYQLRVEAGVILLDPRPNPPGTFVEPVVVA